MVAALSASIGLAAIIGAFLAGMVFAEAREHFELEHQALPVYQFLVPFFFVITGSQVNWRLFLDGGIMGIALGVTALALLGKILGCGAGVLSLARRSIAIVGVRMTPRGEVGLIVASLGLSLGAIPLEIFSVVVIMSILTTLVAPPVLRLLYAGHLETPMSEDDAGSQAGLLPESDLSVVREAPWAHCRRPIRVPIDQARGVDAPWSQHRAAAAHALATQERR